MPDKPQTIALYAAGASLAAVTLYYILGPSIFPDDDLSFNHKGTAGAVGLSNPANDCFINSVLQALAGLHELRAFLQQEVVLREGQSSIDTTGEDISSIEPRDLTIEEGLQLGVVTIALKDILGRLSDRPKYKRTISAKDLITSLEYAFRKGLSRRQQDAQEFLQLISERMCDEYHLGIKLRKNMNTNVAGKSMAYPNNEMDPEEKLSNGKGVGEDADLADVRPFPLEGKLASQIECQTCRYTPTATVSTFVTLTLNVPQVSSTTLDGCLDNLLKVETITDYKCDRCLLLAALSAQQHVVRRASSVDSVETVHPMIADLETALSQGDLSSSGVEALIKAASSQVIPPRRTISKHTRIAYYPKVLCLHLSRSIFDPSSFSMKNTAKIVFKESITLGGLTARRSYRLLCLITHRGGHNSGHYETFRRQDCNLDGRIFSDKSNGAEDQGLQTVDDPAVRKRERRNKQKLQDQWWRISDDRIGDCRTADVLDMQTEAYLLFYGQV